MPNNNPAGRNSPVEFDQFTRTIPYGEKRVQGDLQRSAPLPGGVSAPLNLPRAAQRRATRTTTQSALSVPVAAPSQPLAGVTAPPTTAQVWLAVAGTPGAEQHPILGVVAAAAQRA